MNAPRIVALVMAGGEGSRLRPFTEDCPKPALPFGGGCRIIDFVLSNLHNSAVPHVCVLLQYRPQLLARHLATHWRGRHTDNASHVRILLPESVRAQRFRGTADAVGRSLDCIASLRPDIIAVFAADHVYRMDVRQMAAFHAERDADVTIAAVPVPLASASAFGVIVADQDGRIRGFQEKPARPEPMPGDAGRAYVSMGNYLFAADTLREALAQGEERGAVDFGYDVLPRLVGAKRVFAYDFSRNRVAGVQPWEESAYWRDVGTVDAYIEAQWDLLGPRPRFALANAHWPIRGAEMANVPDAADHEDVVHSIIGPEAKFEGSALRHCILQQAARVEAGAELERCIIMEGAHIAEGVRLRNSIVGSGNMITQAMRLEFQPDEPRPVCRRTPAGRLVVPPHLLGARAHMAQAA